MSKIKKIFKYTLSIIIGLMLTLTIIAFVSSEKRPEGNRNRDADILAYKMLNAIGKENYDATNILQWTFSGIHHFLWDKERNLVRVIWAKNEVILNLNDLSIAKVKVDGKRITDDSKQELVDQAWAYFCNDSFWLTAPLKAFDEGTIRSLVPNKNGGDDLLVSYTSGGTTPGDAYLWQLDEYGKPVSYKMWTSIIPIGGVKASWKNWNTTDTGVEIAQDHYIFSLLNIEISNLKLSHTFQSAGIKDPFTELLN